MQSCRVQTILRSLEELNQPIHVHGTNSAAQAWITLQLANAAVGPSCLILFCPTDEAATDFAADLETLMTLTPRFNERCIEIHSFPTWEHSPYSSIAPSLRTRLSRIATLHRLSSTDPKPGIKTVRIIVTSIPAFSQAAPPPALFKKFSIPIQTGNSPESSIGSREKLIAQLVQAGYFRTDPVEDPGSFAVRGDILDVFPPGASQPLRVELFDDQVERIRYFDPATQRTENLPGSELNRFVFPPAREVLLNPETLPRIREKLKARADDLGIPKNFRDPILEAIQAGNYPEHLDAWAPFAYTETHTVADFLPSETAFLWSDSLGCEQNWDSFLKEQKELAQKSVEARQIMPEVQELFAWNENLAKRVTQSAGIHFDRIELTDLQSMGQAIEGNDPKNAELSFGESTSAEPKISAHQRASIKNNADINPNHHHSLNEVEPKFRLWIKQGFRVFIFASTQSQLERMRFLLEERSIPCQIREQIKDPPSIPESSLSPVQLVLGTLTEGFRWPAEGVILLTESELLGNVKRPRRARKRSTETSAGESSAQKWSGLQALSDLATGDAVVHVDHGIGKYLGLVRLNLSGAPSDFLQLEYANKDKLYLPVYRLNVIQKYAGSSESIALDRLGQQQFQKTKDRVKDAVRKLAIDLVQLYAERKIRPGIRFSPRDALFREFEASFAFDETPDQMKAIDQILTDLESGKAMDRLVCGDVGYGKTEVAMRAAFRAVSDGKQVAILVPTTVLAFQHEQTFRNRFQDYPISIDSISRFKSAKDQKKIIENLGSGKLDLVIGTHRLLSKDVRFKDLGLVVVDEEHRFGVEHKEKLKTLKINAHVLTLTATPIPRTLHMSLSGLRDISIINTPPVDRQPLRTFVSKYDEALIQRAIEFELSRGGQVFFLHNRVQTIHEIANQIKKWVPAANVTVAHGQMGEGELEERMLAFYEKRANVLICTTIIESGLDVPSANTLIVNRADTLGLAQLYQIRGRVGRGQQRAYAYLLIPSESGVSDEAKRRLDVIQRFVELGSGFSVASHDLEIRGGGDLLGPQQSGHIAAVGFDLYMELLEEAIREIKGKPPSPEESRREPEIKAPFPSYLAEDYVPDVHQRLSIYRRFSGATDESQLQTMEEELRDRFGPLPTEAQNLLWVIRIKILLKRMGIDSITVGPEKLALVPGPYSRLDPAKAIGLVAGNPTKYSLMPDSKFVVSCVTSNLRDLYFTLEQLLNRIGG